MKTILDYLKTEGRFEGAINNHDIVIDISGDEVWMFRDEEWTFIKIDNGGLDIQIHIQDYLYEFDSTEIRFCEECGKPYDAGFMAGDGDWYCCEDCFDKAMNETYGKGKWKATKVEGPSGGYYACFDGKEWEDTGVFWTSWN